MKSVKFVVFFFILSSFSTGVQEGCRGELDFIQKMYKKYGSQKVYLKYNTWTRWGEVRSDDNGDMEEWKVLHIQKSFCGGISGPERPGNFI